MKKTPNHFSEPFPSPRQFLMTNLENPSTHLMYPTFFVSYLGFGEDRTPDPEILSQIEAVAVDFSANPDEDYSEIVIRAFHTPDTDLLGFSRSLTFTIKADTKMANEFMKEVDKNQQFMFMVQTNFFIYTAVVDSETNHLNEALVSYRTLN